MKIFISLLIILSGCYGLYYWHMDNELEIQKQEEAIMKDLATEEMKKTFQKLSLGENKKSQNDTVDDSLAQPEFVEKTNVNKVVHYQWDLSSDMPGSESMKKSTLSLLNVLKTADNNNQRLNFSNSKEIENAILEFNKDPKTAALVFEYLMEQSEINEFNGLVANLFKTAGYAKFNKDKIVEIANNISTSSILDQKATMLDEQDSKDQIFKISEASKFVLEAKLDNKNEAAAFVTSVLNSQKNPIIRSDLIAQLAIYYPDEASKLEHQFQQEGEESFKDYLLREVTTPIR